MHTGNIEIKMIRDSFRLFVPVAAVKSLLEVSPHVSAVEEDLPYDSRYTDILVNGPIEKLPPIITKISKVIYKITKPFLKSEHVPPVSLKVDIPPSCDMFHLVHIPTHFVDHVVANTPDMYASCTLEECHLCWVHEKYLWIAFAQLGVATLAFLEPRARLVHSLGESCVVIVYVNKIIGRRMIGVSFSGLKSIRKKFSTCKIHVMSTRDDVVAEFKVSGPCNACELIVCELKDLAKHHFEYL